MTDTDTDSTEPTSEAPEGFDGDALRTAPTDELQDLLEALGPDAQYDADEAAAEAMRRHRAFVERLAGRRGGAAPPRQPDEGDDDASVGSQPGTNASAAAPVAASHAVSVIIGGEAVELRVDTDIVIGRRGDYQIKHPRVSRRHVRLRVTTDGVVCHDLESANGSWYVRAGEHSRLDGAEVALIAGDRVVTIDDLELVRLPDSH